MKKIILIHYFCFLMGLMMAYAQNPKDLDAYVYDRVTMKPIENVTISLLQAKKQFRTNAVGNIRIRSFENHDILQTSHAQYKSVRILLDTVQGGTLNIYLQEDNRSLDTVVMSSGYESISGHMATGAYERIDREQLQRNPTFDIMGRLKNATTGLYFNESYDLNSGGITNSDVLIRGLSTLRTTASGPLIVLDDFPYEGNIADINPNDIADITILKDAAASSIWGARAGNGVIVIKTRKGMAGGKINIDFNSHFNFSSKPNLLNLPVVDTKQYIDMERFLFSKGYFQSMENNRAKPALSPVIEMLIKQRDGDMDVIQLENNLEELASLDVRKQFLKYIYRPELRRQYALGIQGGNVKNQFSASFGYDVVKLGLVGNDNNRITFGLKNSFKPMKGLTLDVHLLYAGMSSKYPSQQIGGGYGYGQFKTGNRIIYPYAQFADENGNALPIARDYREPFINQAANNGLMDWNYYPLDELNAQGRVLKNRSITSNFGLNYRIFENWSFDIKYQYQEITEDDRDFQHTTRYYTRNLINRYSQVTDNGIQYIVPQGGILFEGERLNIAQQFRAQTTWKLNLGEESAIHAFVGTEIRESKGKTSGNQTYGYDDETLTWTSNLNFGTLYPIYGNLASPTLIPLSKYYTETVNRYVSFYGNARYDWKGRYLLSGSIRKDASNLFGVKTNQKWNPLWSLGVGWIVSDEAFMKNSVINFLKLRSSYGYTGNVDNSKSAFTTLNYFSGSPNYEFYEKNASISNPPNPSLRWEKVRTWNLGLDLNLMLDRFNLTIDYYKKKTSDLITATTLDPTTGVTNLPMNVANTNTTGLDLKLTAVHLKGIVKWSGTALFSYNKNMVTKYLLKRTNASNYIRSGIVPEVGYNAFPMFSYRWEGLDGATGDPIGFLGGEQSKDYSKIIINTPLDELQYHGSTRPLYFGSWRNDMTYGRFSVSFTLSYFFKFHFRRPSFSSSAMIGGAGHSDYANRWQQQGDEQLTQVPSFQYPVNSYRDQFYLSSSELVERGDHIRFEDLRLSYAVKSEKINTKINQLSFNLMLNNLGIIWTKNKMGLDPQNPGSSSPPKMVSLGINLKL